MSGISNKFIIYLFTVCCKTYCGDLPLPTVWPSTFLLEPLNGALVSNNGVGGARWVRGGEGVAAHRGVRSQEHIGKPS